MTCTRFLALTLILVGCTAESPQPKSGYDGSGLRDPFRATGVTHLRGTLRAGKESCAIIRDAEMVEHVVRVGDLLPEGRVAAVHEMTLELASTGGTIRTLDLGVQP